MDDIENFDIVDHEKDYSQEELISIPKLYKVQILGILNAIPKFPLSYLY